MSNNRNNQCRKFNQLYRGCQGNSTSCFNQNIGQEYICPQVGPGGIEDQPLGAWFATQSKGKNKMNCHCQNSNIGVHGLCNYSAGGVVDKEASQMSPQFSGQQQGGAINTDRLSLVGVNPGGAVDRSTVKPEDVYPEYYNLAALGYDVKMPDKSAKHQISSVGFERWGCPYNPTCPCGPDCPCGPLCTCGQENSETKTNLGDVTVDLDDSIVESKARDFDFAIPTQSGGAAETAADEIKGIYGVHKLTQKRCRGKALEDYECSVRCDEDERGCPVHVPACTGAERVNYNYLCKGRIRCGNARLAETPNDCCKNCTFNNARILQNPVNPDRQYGLAQAEELPSYYLDLTQPPIGNRPVLVKSNRERIPEILLCDTTHNLDRCFNCKQPCWNDKCM